MNYSHDQRYHNPFQVEKENDALNEKNRLLNMTILSIEERERKVQTNIDEKILKISRLEEEVTHYMSKLESLEMVHKKEMEAQNERVCLIYLYLQKYWQIRILTYDFMCRLVCFEFIEPAT